MKDNISLIMAKEILSGSGFPTIKVIIETENGNIGEALVPRGTSVGKYEAKQIFDFERRYNGFGVRNAVSNINNVIAPALIGMNVSNQREIDKILVDIDGTEDKSSLGANATLGVSLAAARAAAQYARLPLFRYLGGVRPMTLPIPVSTCIEGGSFAKSKLDFEDYCIIPAKFDSFLESIEALSETYFTLGKRLGDSAFASTHGAYNIMNKLSTREVFELFLETFDELGYRDKMYIGLDIVGSNIFSKDNQKYFIEGKYFGANEYIEYLENLKNEYPLIYIEDAFQEDAFSESAKLLKRCNDIWIVGDDLFTTNIKRIKEGIKHNAANTLLLKVNQVGTLTEAFDAGVLAKENNWEITVSIRSKDTIDTFVADLALAIGAKFIKFGPPIYEERVSKYNRLIEIEKLYGDSMGFRGKEL